MTAKELLDVGKLDQAIEALNQEVTRRPTDVRLRTFLFELLGFSGNFERAERQLDVLGQHNEKAGVAVEVYKNLLRGETIRRRCFSEGLRPSLLFDPPAFVQVHLDAVNRIREGQPAEAKALLARSEEMRASRSGRVGGQAFSQFRDYDDLLAPILEVFAKNAYVWLPFEHIQKITIPPPKHLRDLLWTPAMIETSQGPPGEVFLPVLYWGSAHKDDDLVRLGRMTAWEDVGEGVTCGYGRKTFLVDGKELSLLEVTDIEFELSGIAGQSSVH